MKGMEFLAIIILNGECTNYFMELNCGSFVELSGIVNNKVDGFKIIAP